MDTDQALEGPSGELRFSSVLTSKHSSGFIRLARVSQGDFLCTPASEVRGTESTQAVDFPAIALKRPNLGVGVDYSHVLPDSS